MSGVLSSTTAFQRLRTIFYVLPILIWLQMTLNLLSFIAKGTLLDMLRMFASMLAGPQLIVMILFLVFYSLWIYRFHENIREVRPGYQISANDAMLRIWIPFYNLFGLWSIYTTFAGSLKKEEGYLKGRGDFLDRYFSTVYLSCLILNIGGQIVFIFIFSNFFQEYAEVVSSAFSYIIYIVWFLFLFKFSHLMQRCFEQMAAAGRAL